MKMKDRCYKKNVRAYNTYGARGIRICDEWLNDFKVFYDWAMSNGYTDELTIERIDVNGNYCPENCTWIPLSEQSKNRTCVRKITFNNMTMTMAEWDRFLGFGRGMVSQR